MTEHISVIWKRFCFMHSFVLYGFISVILNHFCYMDSFLLYGVQKVEKRKFWSLAEYSLFRHLICIIYLLK